MVPPAQAQAHRPSAGAWMLERMLGGATLDQASREAQDTGYPRNEVYRAKLRIGEMFEEE